MSTPTNLKYRLDYSDEEPGGERIYVVMTGRNHELGSVGSDMAPHPTIEGGTPVRAWWAKLLDGRTGFGLTRPAAMADAMAQPEPQNPAIRI